MQENLNFIQENSSDGGFLQSKEWRSFQESFGRATFHLEAEDFWSNIVVHSLPFVGSYFYIPRGPVFKKNSSDQLTKQLQNLVDLAKKEKAGWIRVDAESEEKLTSLKQVFSGKIEKAPHDVQPKQIFVLDISKNEKELLAEMKSKTRYNIRLAEKKGVQVFVSKKKEHIDRFCELVEVTAKRQGINSHPKEYYQKMLEIIPEENIKLYCAEFDGVVIATNLVIFFGNMATYLHGASDDRFRNVMAPYLLQWKQIKAAKELGCKQYDFGGVKIGGDNEWAGITNFKSGFSPETKPLEFQGSYDVVVSRYKYALYRILQWIKGWM
jgi:lipid II:glycine glycyltransferase (peptidoglycan interpeptide bridge formation enzyme)